MNSSPLRLQLDDPPAVYQPGNMLSGQFWLEGVNPGDIRAVEVSVLWHTEGKGEQDMSVHYFERIEPQNGHPVDFRQPQRFRTVLPNSPLSYDGLIVKINWLVRVRVFLLRGKEIVSEAPFWLGAVPQASEVAP